EDMPIGGRWDVGLTSEMGSCKASENPEEDLQSVQKIRLEPFLTNKYCNTETNFYQNCSIDEESLPIAPRTLPPALCVLHLVSVLGLLPPGHQLLDVRPRWDAISRPVWLVDGRASSPQGDVVMGLLEHATAIHFLCCTGAKPEPERGDGGALKGRAGTPGAVSHHCPPGPCQKGGQMDVPRARLLLFHSPTTRCSGAHRISSFQTR
ncbi:hypothetical protein E2320_008653, partial [Naja naja]